MRKRLIPDSIPMPPAHEMGPSQRYMNNMGLAQGMIDNMSEEERTLVHDFGMNDTVLGAILGTGSAKEARALLEAQRGKPLVPLRKARTM